MGTAQASGQTENLRNMGSFIIKGLNIHTSLTGVAVATTVESWASYHHGNATFGEVHKMIPN